MGVLCINNKSLYEVFYGRIKDTFTPVIIEKMKSYGAEIHGHILCNDDMEKITAAIMK